MSLVLPALAALAQSGLRDIKETIPLRGLPPFAFSALVAFTVAAAGAFSAAVRKWGPRFECADPAEPVDRLLKLCDAYCDGTLPQNELFDLLWDELSSLGLTGAGTPAADPAVPAAGDVAHSKPWALLRSLLITCDAVRHGNQTLEKEQVIIALNDAVAVVTAWGGRGL